MSEIRCTMMRRSKFIDRNMVFKIEFDEYMKRYETSVVLRTEFKELGVAFLRNKVTSRFEIKEANKLSGPSNKFTKRAKQPDFSDIKEQITEFCDIRLEGYWTWKVQSKKDRDDPEYLNVTLEMFFEHESDLELFLKECGTIIKLAY